MFTRGTYWIFISAIWIVMTFGLSSSARAQIESLVYPNLDKIVVCPASSPQAGPPDFKNLTCVETSFFNLNPQGRLMWMKSTIDLQNLSGPEGQPMAIFISGKMSSKVYLNGQYIGNNGIPAHSSAEEIPGQMDVVLYPPQSLFHKGSNEVVILASSHNGYIDLASPVHAIAIGEAANVTDRFLRHYWLSLITLGLFILGILYFGTMALVRKPRTQALTFCLICTFAAGQLVFEILRGLTAYPYPVHDIRLVMIVLCSAGFSLAVAFHVFATFSQRYRFWIIFGLAVLVLVGVIVMSGFDEKALIALTIPLLASLIAAGLWTYQRRPRAFIYFLILLTFISGIFMFNSLFLDSVFFFMIALFLLVLFLEQGMTLVKEMKMRGVEEARANRLQLALDQVKEREGPSEIIIKSVGKIDRISTDRITHCKGASGYSEIVLQDGREFLHSASLAELEETLPSTFLRVHRSHLINTGFVKSLKRDASGTGLLILSDESEIPVSRRIMPQVRQALG